MVEEQPDLFHRYRYHLRYFNGSISKGWYKTFEAAIKGFNDCKHSGRYANLYDDLMDVVAIEIEASVAE